MARPCKKRRICSKPRWRSFKPVLPGQIDSIELNLDEFECIRLIDYEGLDQEACAFQMGVARTTVQAIYKNAREKIADSLVNAKELSISSEDVFLCESGEKCSKRYCFKKILIQEKGERVQMRIAVTFENGMVFQHFGHTEQFKFYDIEDNKVVKESIVDTNGSGHGALAVFLATNNVDVLICGGIGGGAQMALAESGIKLYGGVNGNADDVIKAFLANNLDFNPDVKCNHHGDEHHGNCGNHGCGSHSCH